MSLLQLGPLKLIDSSGNAVANVPVQVSPGPVYANATGTQQPPNGQPVTNAQGYVTFFAPAGTYTLSYSPASGTPQTVTEALPYVPPTGPTTTISPSGDTTGLTDTAVFLMALQSFGATISGTPGAYVATGGVGAIEMVQNFNGPAYWFSANLPTVNSPDIGWTGPGAPLCTVRVAGTLAGTSGAQTSFVEVTNTAFNGHVSNAQIGGFTIRGTGAGNYVSGYRFGDRIGQYIFDLLVEDFTGTGSIGCDWLNQYGWTEQMTCSVRAVNNTLNYSFDAVTATGGTNSFDYGEWSLFHNSPQNGVYFGQANFGGSHLNVRGNSSGGASNYMFNLSSNAQIKDCVLEWESEWDGTGTGPVTIQFASGAQLLPSEAAISFINSGWQSTSGGSSATVSISGTLNMPSTETFFPAGRSSFASGVQIVAGSPYAVGTDYPNYAITLGTITPVTGKIYSYPFLVTKAHTFQTISVWCTAGGTAALLSLGAYADNNGSAVGGALVSSFGTVTAATATNAAITITWLPTSVGWYHLSINPYSATAACTLNADTSQRQNPYFGQTANQATQNQPTGFISTASTFTTGTLPGTFPAASQGNPVPFVKVTA